MPKRPAGSRVDPLIAAGFLIAFALFASVFQYRHALAEHDLYHVAVGLLDGAVTGQGLSSPMHYGKAFGFGYIGAMYTLFDNRVLRDPETLIPLMNNIGLWAAICGLALFWLSVRLLHGSRAATVSLILFAFSPMTLELATSGHQVLIAFAFLCAGSVCLFARAKGWRAVALKAAAGLLFLTGLTMRAEIFVAFPYVVLAGADMSSWKAFLRSAGARAAAPAAALGVFLVLQRSFGASMSYSGFLADYYRLASAAQGAVSLALGCGVVTTLAGCAVLAWIATKRLFRGTLPARLETLEACAGPIVLIVVALLFWLPNPMPSRHFLLLLAGVSILAGWVAATVLAVRPITGALLALAIVVANQALTEPLRPMLSKVRYTTLVPVPGERPTIARASLGWAWRHHEILQSRRAETDAFADSLLTACDARILVFSEAPQQIFARLYAGGVPVQATRVKYGGFWHMSAIRGGRRIDFISGEGWPQDAVAAVLGDDAFRDFKLIADPYSRTVSTKTAIPPDRDVRLGCR